MKSAPRRAWRCAPGILAALLLAAPGAASSAATTPQAIPSVPRFAPADSQERAARDRAAGKSASAPESAPAPAPEPPRKKKKAKRRVEEVGWKSAPELGWWAVPPPPRGPARAGTGTPPSTAAPAPAPAEEQPSLAPEAEEEADAGLRPTVNGFFESRSFTRQDEPKAGIAKLRSPFALLANVQARARAEGERVGVAGDLTLYGASSDPDALALVNEAYVDARVLGPLRVLVGRRRLVWGSGLALNPTDLVNPPKDALDPELQRTGAFLLPMVDVSLGPVIVSGFVSPRAHASSWGFPDELHFDQAIHALRLYALVGGFDANLIYYRDEGQNRNLFGLATSGFVSDVVELHLEALGRTGAADLPPVPVVPACGGPLQPTGQGFPVTALVGTRMHFSDESIGVLEYSYDANGLDGANFDRFRQSLPCVAAAMAAAGSAATTSQDGPLGLPVDSAPILRQHHVFVNYTRPHLTRGALSDVIVSARAAVSVEDPSAVLQAEIGYRFGGRAVVIGRGTYWAGSATSEMGLWPSSAAAMLQLRVSY